MKIRIITIHFGRNYGSVLQAYALNSFLVQKGFDTKTIDYVPRSKSGFGLYKYIFCRKCKIYIVARYLLSTPIRVIKDYPFKRFIKKNLHMTKKYNNFNGVDKESDFDTIYLTGSDQVWNYDYNVDGDYSYFLDGITHFKKKISYAASFGKDEITDDEKNRFVNFLSEFNAISVRDDSSSKILKAMGLNSKIVLDPTMLFSKEEWAVKMNLQLHKVDFVLAYVIDGKYDDVLSIAKNVADEKKLPLYLISFKRIIDKKISKQYVCCSLHKFLELIYNATYIVTNSFHGTIFSINFEKQFISVKKNRYNSRLQGLLNTLGLESRYVMANLNEIVDLVNTEINYVYLKEKIQAMRIESIDFLIRNIEECNE